MSFNAIRENKILAKISESTVHTGNFHRKGYRMLRHFAGATIQLVANLVIVLKRLAIIMSQKFVICAI